MTTEAETFFLTNGTEFLGPYLPEEVRAQRRAYVILRQAGDVHRVKADSLLQARRTWRARNRT